MSESYGAVDKAALESRRSRVLTPLWPSSFKETKCFFSAHRFNIVVSLRDREVAGLRLPGVEFQILCSEGSVLPFISASFWPSLAYMYTKVALDEIFYFIN